MIGGAWPARRQRARDRQGSGDWAGESRVRVAHLPLVCGGVAMPTAAVAGNARQERRMRLRELFSPQRVKVGEA